MGGARVDISVIVATRNRADSLKELLQSLAAQQLGAGVSHEVLVADNGSTDHTRQVVEAARQSLRAPLRYYYEPRPGRPWALNAAMAEAQGTLLVFTDDDIITDAGWLEALWRCYREEQVDAITGKILPRWLSPRPAWLTDQALRSVATLGCLDYGSVRRRTLDGQDCRWVGGNMAIGREAAQRVGGYDVRMVRSQDTEYYRRCVSRGLKICYEPQAVVFHKIGAERMTAAYFRRWRRRTGFYNAAQMPWRPQDRLTLMPLWWYRHIARLLGQWGLRLLRGRPWLERFRLELLLHEQFGVFQYRVARWLKRT